MFWLMVNKCFLKGWFPVPLQRACNTLWFDIYLYERHGGDLVAGYVGSAQLFHQHWLVVKGTFCKEL